MYMIILTQTKPNINGERKALTFGPFEDEEEAFLMGTDTIEEADWNDEEEEGDFRYFSDYCTWAVFLASESGNFDYSPNFLEKKNLAKEKTWQSTQ